MKLINVTNQSNPEIVSQYWGGTDITDGTANLSLLGGKAPFKLSIELAELDSVINALEKAQSLLVNTQGESK